MTQNKAKIEINAKPLGLFVHLYILYTDSNGNKKVFSGGPGNRESAGFKMYYENLKVFFAEYREGHPDFQKLEEEKIKPRPSILIYEGSDADAKISKMLSLLEKINAGKHDYKIPVPNWIRKVFGSDSVQCHNSNTVIRALVEEAGIEFKLPVDKSGKEVNAICFDSEIKDTAFDKFLKSEEMTDEEVDIVTWELVVLSAGGGAGGIVLRVIGNRLYHRIQEVLRERKQKDDNDPSDDEDDDLNSGGAVAAGSMKAAKVVPTGPIVSQRELKEIIEESRAEVKIAEDEVREYYKEEANLGKNVLTEEEFAKKVLEHLQLKENARQAQYFLHQQAMNWIVDKGLQIKESAGKLGKNFDELAIDYKNSIKSQQAKIQELKIAAGDELQKKLDVLLQEANESLKGAREANEKKMEEIKEEYNSKIKVLYDQINEKVEKEYRDQSAKLMQRLNDELQVANKAVYDDVNLRLRQGELAALLQPEADRRTSENKAKYQMLYDQESKMILSSIMEDGESRAEAAEIKKLQQEANDKISAIHDLNKEAHAKFTQEYTSKKDELEAATIQMMHDQQKKIATEFEAMRHNLEVVLHEQKDLNDAIKGLPEILSLGIKKDSENYGLPGFQYYSSNAFNTKTLASSANDFVDDVSKSTFTLKDSHAGTFTTQGFSPYTRGRFDFWKSAIDNSIFGTPIDYTKINYGQHEEGTRPLNSFEFDLYLKPLLGSIADYAGSSYEAFQDAFQSAKREFFSWSPRISAADLAKLTVVGGTLIGAARFAASSTPFGMAAAAISSMMVIFKEKLAYATTHVSPIILDLNGDGVKTYNYKEGVYFDYDADDFAEKVGWISEEDGFLAMDLNGNDRIDNIRELFGNDFIPAYFKLELMDSNRDGVIDAKDRVFDTLLVWQDKNKNGYSEKSEIKTLRELGITSLSLQREKLNKIVNGNIFTDKSTFTYADGRTFEAIDVLFENDDMDSQYVGDPLENEIKIPESVYKLPNMNGFGVVPPLWIAMLKNKKLHQQVEDFVQLKPSEFSQIHIKSQEIIYEWTGVNEWSDDMSMTATGLNIDGRKVGVIEKFSGQPFRQLGIAKFVGQHASTALNEAYLMVLNQLVQNLLVQGLFKPIFKEAVYYGFDRTVRLNIGIDEILHRSKDYISDAKSYWSIIWDEGYDFWMQIGYILAANKVELGATVDSIRKKIKEISGYSIYIGEKEFELIGDDFDNVIVGGAASEVIKGLGGNDKLSGGAGDDLIDGGKGNDEIHGGPGRDRLYSGAGDDKVYGDEGRDFIYCGPGNDYAEGGAGDDNIEGGEGADEMDGGPGTDTLSYARSEAGVFINLASKVARGGDAERDKFKNFENIGGSEFDDELHGDDLPNHINGESGNDKIYGGGGADHLFGATGDDEIYGEDGDDFITGFSGIDKIDGGPGNDTVSYHHPYAISGVTVNLSTGKGTGGHAEGDTYQNIENILGSRHDDILIGDGNDNSIFGMEGDDEIYGGGGNDKIVGGSGYNILHGEDGDDIFWLGEGSNRVDGGSGSDTVDYSKSKHRVHASLSNNTSKIGRLFDDYYKNIENIAGSLFDDEIIGDNQDNKLFGLDGNDTIRGEGGNDVLVGGKGADFLDGGDGVDTADYSSSSESVIVNLEDAEGHGGDAEGDIYESIENIAGSLFDDEITGNDKDNKLFGLDGNDTIRGAGGNDVLVGGRGADFLDGGDGIDHVSYFSSDTFVEVNLAAQVGKNGDAEGDRYLNIEGVIASKHNDKIIGSETRDFLDGKEGDDAIYGGKGDDFITGGTGNNKLFGEEGDDIFFLEDGSNYVDGGVGINTVTYKNYRLKEWQSIEMIRSLYAQARLIADGVAKDFVLSFDNIGVKINISANNAERNNGLSDKLFNIQNIAGSNFNDEIIGNDLNNYIIGLNGDDIILGGSGDDTIIPGNGTNKVYGESGNDFIIAGDGRDYIDGGDGIDSITYRNSKDGIVVNLGTGECSSGDADGDKLTGIENIEGSNNRDIIYDSSDNNTIATGEDDDEIYLSKGKDIVAAGAGDDKIFMQGTGKKYLIGGEGSDKFIFSTHFAETENKENLQVMIMDFAVNDHYEKIDLSRVENIRSFQDLQITQIFKSTKDLNIPEILIPSLRSQDNLKFTVITLSETQTVFLYNVQSEILSSDNFIFSNDLELIPRLNYSHSEL